MREPTFRTMRPKTDPLWKSHDFKAQKSGQRATVYWVGKSIIGEDGSHSGKFTNGASYHGEWNHNKKSGYGVQVFPNGEKYEGQWEDGLRSGQGTLWVPVGKAGKLRKLYVGGWMGDRRHGKGTCFFKNGEFFQGFWDHGKMHGQGTLRYGNGDLYIGEWHNGLRSGHGTLNRSNGDSYEGYWLNDKREGSGSYFYAQSGKVFVGEWANDLPKAGVYTQAQPNPEQASPVPVTTTLPSVKLANPTDVLEKALAAVRELRKGYRMRNMPIHSLFEEDEMDALRQAFESTQGADGTIQSADLQGLCMSLGTEVDDRRLQRLLKEAGIATKEDDTLQVSVGFQEFLRLVALILDEEAAAAAGASTSAPSHGAYNLYAEDNLIDEFSRMAGETEASDSDDGYNR